jgi:Dullard-like phosphatase family protein
MLLVLDLDETLIFATETALSMEPDFDIGEYVVYKRPYLDTFLDFCRETFEVAVWTASTKPYAEAITPLIFEPEYPLVFIWARRKCIQRFNPERHEVEFIKDLRKVKKQGHSLEQIIAIDDSPEKYAKNYGNLVRVSPFIGDQKDEELLYLMDYLLELKDVEDVRGIEKRNWQSSYFPGEKNVH